MMYIWDRGRFGLPLLWKTNGIPIHAGRVRLHRQSIVWWMPVNWLSMLVILTVWPFAKCAKLVRRALIEKEVE